MCKKCDDLGYKIKGKERILCICKKATKVVVYAGSLVESLFKVSNVDRKKLAEEFREHYADRCFFRLAPETSRSFVDSILLYFLLAHSQPTYRIFNIYELIEICFRVHPEVPSIRGLRYGAYCLLEGFWEFPNVRQSDAVLQFLESVPNNVKIIYVSIKEPSEEVINYVKAKEWKIVDWTVSKGTKHVKI